MGDGIAFQVWSGSDVDDTGDPSPDGRYISHMDRVTGDLAVYEIATGENRRLTDKGSWDDSREFVEYCRRSPDSKQIAFVSNSGI